MNELYAEREHFCDDCPHIYDCGGFDFGYGAPRYISELTCRADLDPEDGACPGHAEYMALLDEIEAREEALCDDE